MPTAWATGSDTCFNTGTRRHGDADLQTGGRRLGARNLIVLTTRMRIELRVSQHWGTETQRRTPSDRTSGHSGLNAIDLDYRDALMACLNTGACRHGDADLHTGGRRRRSLKR